MRRWLSGGVLLSLGLFAGHAAVEAWMETRAVFALEEAGRRLPEGSRLAWQRLDAYPLRLALAIEGVRLDLPAGAAVRLVELGTLRLAQAGGGIAGFGRVGSVRAENVTVELAEGAGRLRIAAIEGARVDIDALTAALAQPEPWEALAELRLGPLALEELEFERGDATLRVPRLAIGALAERRLEGLALEALEARDGAGGRLGLAALAIDRLDLEATDPATWERLSDDPAEILSVLDRFRIDGLRLGEVSFGDGEERLDLARLELGRLGEGRLEAFRLERLGFEGAEGRGALAFAEIERVDWSRVRVERLVRAGTLLAEAAHAAAGEADEEGNGDVGSDAAATDAGQGSEDTSLAESFASMETVGELARLEVGEIRIEGLAAGEPGGAGVALDRFRFDGIAERRLGAVELGGLAIRGEEAVEIRLERFEQSALAIPAADFADRVERAPRTAEALQELTVELARLPWESRSLLAGFSVSKNGSQAFAIERVGLAFEQKGSKKATRFELDGLVLDPAVLDEGDLRETLAAAGIERLQLGSRLSTLFDEASLEAALDPFELDAPGFLALRTSIQGKLGADPVIDPVTASTDALLFRAELRLEDKGLIDRRLDSMAKEAGKKRADFAKQLVRDLRRDEPGRSLLDQKRAAALETFLTRPKVLVIRLAPPKPVTFMAGFMGLLATPGQTAKTLGLAIEARDS